MFELAFCDLNWATLAAQASDAATADALNGVKLVARVLHALGGMTIVGGLLFMRFALTPALGELPADEAASTQTALYRRWAKWVGVAVAALLVSGFYSLFEVVRLYEVPKYYHPAFGVKFLLALFVFFIASVLAGRSPAAERFRQRSTFWLNLALLASLAVVALAVVLGLAPKTLKHEEPQSTANIQYLAPLT